MSFTKMSPIMLYMYNFVLNHFIYFDVASLSARVLLPVGLYFRLVYASSWFMPPVGLCFRLVYAFGWFMLPVGLCFRLVCANGKKLQTHTCTNY